MAETELNKLKKTRGIARTSVTKVVTKLESELAKPKVDVDELELLMEHLNEKAEKLRVLDSELINILKIGDLDDELKGVEEYTEKITTCRFLTKRKLREVRNGKPIGEHTPTDSGSEIKPTPRAVKLPKLVIPRFYGDLKEWLGFWNSFRSSIHEIPSLNGVDKFNYLKSFLGGTALSTIEGLELTNDIYNVAVELLEDRFGDNNVLINAHIEQLLKLNPLKNSHDIKQFRKLFDHVQKNLRSLQSLGVTSDNYSAILTPMLLRSLPSDLVLEYNKTATGGSNLKDLLDFLSKQLSAREKSFANTPTQFRTQESSKQSYPNNSSRKFNQPTSTELISVAETNKKRPVSCIFCNQSHFSSECSHANSMSSQERVNKCKQFGYCFRCLRSSHRKSECKSRVFCKLCNSINHLSVMCSRENQNSKPEYKQTLETQKTSNGSNETENNLWNRINERVYLQTVIVKTTRNKKDYFLRAIIDTASSRTFVSRFVANKLKLKCVGSESILHGLFGGEEKRLNHNRYSIDLRDIHDKFSCTLTVMDQQKICAAIPKLENTKIIEEMNSRGIYLSDLNIKENLCLYEKDPREIHLLIGADYAGKLYTGEIKTLSNGLIAMNTHFGWTILGAAAGEEYSDRNETLISLHVNSVKISDIWSLDSLGITDPALSQTKKENEESALRYFNETITRDSEGRYEVALPWVENHPELPDNLALSKKRLKSCVSALKGKDYLNQYENVFNEWITEGVIEVVSDTDKIVEGCHHLPHRAVIKEHSTTPVRPVFDASAKEKNSVSLNDCIQKGPNYLELIPKLLTKFRIGLYGVTADIRRAFLQISVRSQDRDYLRFLWWEGGNPENIKTYRHKRVVFGVNASPFLLAATINHHLGGVAEQHRATALKLKESMYVDNCVASVNSLEELETFINQSKEIMQAAKFDLRDWRRNELPNRDSNPEPDPIDNNKGEVVPVLGIKWDLHKDSLLLDVKDEPKLSPNKRQVLSMMHRIFDPIGFASPVTIIPKQILQECWKRKINWDEILPPDLAKKFIRWATQLKCLNDVEIPRKIPTLDQNVTLHVFCDASSIAYATCIFLRRDDGNKVECQLLLSRAKIAPVKSLTIPRLEVLSCTIGARLAKTLKEDLKIEGIRTFFWCDSMNALYWIKREENWATFIFNRINEIRKISDPEEWHHIPGKFNPADFPSRGCSPKQLETSKWWLGPDWLYQPPEEWPSTSGEVFDPDVINAERRKTVMSTCITTTHDDLFEKISDFYKILKIVSWINRFFKNAKVAPPQRAHGPISLDEIRQAETILYKYIQKQSFNEGNSKNIRNLQPITDAKGIIRIQSRIMKRKDDENFRLPILLPSEHPLVLKLMKREHEEMGHAGTQFVMNKLREKFWLLKGRRTIRKVVRSCVHCRRFDAPAGEVPQSTLPEDRIRDAKIFEIIGVDLTGPLYLKGKQKVWITLFTCAVYRAVHLELTSNLSTESFLRAFRRFVSRRGRPAIVYSDNGTNFVGTDNLFKTIDWSKIASVAVEQKIDWKFIPPSSPWWGGWWERLIGVMKRILRKVLGRSSLDYESLLTVLCDVESTMNNRPLTYLSEDVDDLVALTPAMFLHELPMSGVPDIDYVDKVSLKKALLYQNRLRDDLRSRFRIEYLGQLRQGSKYIKDPTFLKVGDMVFVTTSKKRVNWPLARISEIAPSADGHVRLVKVKTSDGELSRTVQQLIPLEADFDYLRDYVRKLRSSKARPQGGSVA